jgi:ribonucleotide monophosphatase NagD (HAD superfamily)
MTPLDGTDVIFADLDGVVYTGEESIRYAVDALNDASTYHRVAYVTNNASRTTEQVATQLRTLGLDADADDVVSSPQAAVKILKTLIPAKSTVLVIGGEGLIAEVAGARTTDRSADRSVRAGRRTPSALRFGLDSGCHADPAPLRA